MTIQKSFFDKRKINQLVSGLRLDKALSKIYKDYSRSQIKKWIIKGYVKVDGEKVTKPKKTLHFGETIEIHFSLEKKTKNNISLNIIYEDDDIIIFNKPHNLVVHPGIGNTSGTLLDMLIQYFPPISKIPRSGIVHRLDKNTTGLMVIAKTLLAKYNLEESLKTKNIIRKYEAIVIGRLRYPGFIEQPISRHRNIRTKMAVNQSGKPALTRYYIIEEFHSYTHIGIYLHTGRTHQIRVHMSYINHPLLGDCLYGGCIKSKTRNNYNKGEIFKSFNRQALHSTLLQIYHPRTSIKMKWEIPLPDDMKNLLLELKTNKI